MRQLEITEEKLKGLFNFHPTGDRIKNRRKIIKRSPKDAGDVIEQIIYEYFGSYIGAAKGKSKRRNILHIRHLIHFFMRKYTHLTAKKIGELYTNKDHATVLHSAKKVNGWLDIGDERITKDVRGINKLLYNRSLTK